MSQNLSTADIAARRVVYNIPEMQQVTVKRDVVYATRDGRSLTMDLYLPSPEREPALRPGAILVTGYPDPGLARIVGRPAKELGTFVSWAQLLAASGMVAITYSNDVPGDAQAMFDYLRQHGRQLGIDSERLGLWACSGHGPSALSLLIRNPGDLRCVCLMSAYTVDLPEAAHVAQAAALFRFATMEGTIADLPPATPLFVARAGGDAMPGLNDALDAFVGAAIERNLPVTLINHPTGPHAFDVFEDSDVSREIIAGALRFLRFHLGAGAAAPPPRMIERLE